MSPGQRSQERACEACLQPGAVVVESRTFCLACADDAVRLLASADDRAQVLADLPSLIREFQAGLRYFDAERMVEAAVGHLKLGDAS
jgi:hypothetical protein